MAEQSENINTAPPTIKKKITLMTADGNVFDVEKDIAMEFETVKAYIEEADIDEVSTIPLPNVETRCMANIIKYCEKHVAFRRDSEFVSKDDIKAFDEEFVKDMAVQEIIELLMAANYLNAKELLDFLNQKVADHIKNKSVEYVRKLFGIVNDFTPEEEKKLREKDAWAFEGVDAD